MRATAFTDLVGCRVPLQLAAMPGINTPQLIAAVANAGGLAMIGLPMMPAPAVAAALEDLSARCDGVLGANFLMPFLDLDALDAAATRARVIEFFYGEPDAALVRRASAGGAVVGWQAGSVAEAEAAVAAGCRYVVAQGVEAGGHVRGTMPRSALLAEVTGAVSVPVLAAGGIGNARDVAAALAAGAAGVRVGTRFVASEESGAHPQYVEALLHASAEDAVLTGRFSVMWPNAPHRVLQSCIDAAEAHSDDSVGETEMAPGMRMTLPRFSVPAPTRTTTGNIAAMCLYAGRSVGDVTSVQPAADIIRELCEGAEHILAEE
ncbi:MAG TPA: nitronate monooxygenase [Candidatus Binatia bacterium]|nr:nitronate monooxygenase [Candidatus Binatia bacterium]